MTDNEIIKALEYCKGGLCCGCPRLSNGRLTGACMRELITDVLDLINRQQAEIERLKRELDIALESDPSKTHPYEVITPYGVVFSKCGQGYEDFKTDIKSEAIKEFAERLCEGRVSNDPVVIAVKAELKELNDNG